jgi:hypothetical protein
MKLNTLPIFACFVAVGALTAGCHRANLQTPPGDIADRDEKILDLFLAQELSEFRKYQDALKTGDKAEQAFWLRALHASLFRLWLFYFGPDKVQNDMSKPLERTAELVRPVVPEMKKLEVWSDPLGILHLFDTNVPGGTWESLDSAPGKIYVPRLDLKKLRSPADYEALVDSFHEWLTGHKDE